MRKQIVPDPIEFLDFHLDITKRSGDLEALICGGNYIPSPILRLTNEKSKGLCRQISLPHPADAIILQALSNKLWQEIKNKAPSKTAFYAPQDQPFSKRHVDDDEDEWGYGPIASWMDFQKEILKFSKSRKFVVVTDIANYYDFIIHQFLRSILSDYGLEREHSLDLLLYILDATLWRPDYMPNFGIGLPQMDLDAPRLLAHTHLFEIDAIFSSDPNLDYARFMDDIDFGVDSIAKAKTVLRDLDLALQTRNLRLNSGKTKILTAAEAREHFKIFENSLIDKLNSRLNERLYLERWSAFYGRLTIKILRSALAREKFSTGNGSKLVKRLLSILKRTRTSIPSDVFKWMLVENPGLRRELFQTWSLTGVAKSHINRLVGFLLSGEAIDDMIFILSINAIVHAKFERKMSNKQFSELRYALKQSEPSLLFARLQLVSRFDTPSLLMNEIANTKDIWSRHKFLSRHVAGFTPLFFDTPLWPEFAELIKRWAGDEGMSVFEFHESLRDNVKTFNSIRAFLAANNSTSGTNVTHSKALMLLSALSNGKISKIERAKLLAKHFTMMEDVYYFRIFSNALRRMP